MADIAERSKHIVSNFLEKQASEGFIKDADPLNIGEAFYDMTARLMTDPKKLLNAQMNLWRDYFDLCQGMAKRMMGEEVKPVIEPKKGDRRFRDDAWQENDVFDFIKQSYLLTSEWLQSVVESVDGLNDEETRKIEFYTAQLTDALSPTNFAMTNPEVLRATAETKGGNLLHGLQHMLEDMEKGSVSMTDTDAFKVGLNVATTEGKVIFQNDLMQLIQYDPSTKDVHKTPVLFVPPWINKYYILDLREKNSMVKWLVDQGHTVFMISWVNPGKELANKGFAEYMTEGPLAALDAIEKQTGEKQINAAGYCLGGTLLATALAYMAEKKDNRIKSATLFASMVDFTDVGDIRVFIDEEQVQHMEDIMRARGFLDGRSMASAFNMLRSRDLIWSFVINNYLLGKEPFPFDLLYWNSDATRLPAAMHSFYLRQMYMDNSLAKPGKVEINGVKIDLRKIKTPIYMVSSREDHIAPWMTTYRGTQIFSGPVRFVLAASGHIAGIINHPDKKKYSHTLNNKSPEKAIEWLKDAKEHEGSWWPNWDKWLTDFSTGKVASTTRNPEKGKMKVLENAPGAYVKVRSMDENNTTYGKKEKK
ncbi:MAG: class I poly(R)-hydroxyalkanoic acid synthase [Alphaproteobacteria bacterium]|nr:class I poly(R)-hydroxyalkanoic acid synthase [Alphaproteobacteria bacterium]